MSLNFGNLMSMCIFAVIFVASFFALVKYKEFHPLLYWTTIIAITVGTTLADFADRSLGMGYTGGTLLLLTLLIISLFTWYHSLKPHDLAA